MGSRGRSIRLRIYFLVAIPLVAMVGLLAYVAGTSVNNAINLDRAPNLINATSLPTAIFTKFVQNERAAAVVYLFQPTPANLAAYHAAVKATDADKPTFLAAMKSPGTKGSETADEAKAIGVLIAGLNQMPALRAASRTGPSPAASGRRVPAGIQNELKLFLAEADSLTNATAAAQALGLIGTVSAREALSEEYALLSGVLAGNRITQADRAAFAEMAATRQGDVVDADSLLDPAGLAVFNAPVNNAEQTQLTQIEGAVSAGTPVAKLPVTLAQWNGLAGHLLDEYFTGGLNLANAQLKVDHSISRSAWIRVAVTAGIGLLGPAGHHRGDHPGRAGHHPPPGRPGAHRARQLAEVQLPDVVARLRRGEDVDVNAEAPPLRVGGDEIGRVGQAFDLVRQTAVRSAVEEARLRQGLNDVFRSLARRSQSLLHRQLTLLDQMERRATDPEALDDLFRLDHLTTRMRRHAEGLVILAGAPPGRGWSSPVRMVDVMRGAIAEVEDYARVSVATRSQAALVGSAVADVIHLLAELIENATTLSPPYTSVRVSGDTVANGFAIEVEDRGLGISAQRLAELNDRLTNPPEFNPSDSEQLGLFVVSQLARRHGIRVTLKASPYGGTAAIVLIPRHLVVTEEAFRAGLPGEPASVAMGSSPPTGTTPTRRPRRNWPPRAGRGSPSTASGLPGLAQAPGSASPDHCAVRRGSSRSGSIAVRTPRRRRRPRSGRRTAPAGTGPADAAGAASRSSGAPAEAGLVPNGTGAMPDSGAAGRLRRVQAAAARPGDRRDVRARGRRAELRRYPGDGSYVASPSFPASGSSPYPGRQRAVRGRWPRATDQPAPSPAGPCTTRPERPTRRSGPGSRAAPPGRPPR